MPEELTSTECRQLRDRALAMLRQQAHDSSTARALTKLVDATGRVESVLIRQETQAELKGLVSRPS